MKTRWIQLSAGLAMVVLCISTCATTSNAAVVWSDDFENPALPGWTIYGWSNRTTSYEIIEGNFSAASGRLTALDDDINIAIHDSTTNVGTWIFDLFIPEYDDDDFWGIYVTFMSNGSRPALHFTNMEVDFGAWNEALGLITMELVGYEAYTRSIMAVDSIEGWHHVAISRSSDNRFLIALNGTIAANYTSDAVTSSTYLEFFCNNATGAAIDNLVVSDDPGDINLDGDNTTILIIAGVGIAVVVIVLVVVFAKRR
ncbi:MAG: hypothetical protein ACFFCP_12735 [Promethearchaeota archaeon]